MTTGRNDPCPCGSGRKFKKCHGLLALASVAPPPETTRANELKALDMEMTARLARFAKTRLGPAWLAAAAGAYVDSAGTEPADGEMALALTGALYFLPVEPDGRTLADLWRDERAQRLSTDELLLLDAYNASWLSIWEVTDVKPGVGTLMTDVLTRQQRFAHDVSSSTILKQYDVLLAIVLECDSVSFFGGVHEQPLPPRAGDAVAQDARRMCRVRTRPAPVDTLRDPAMHRDLIIRWRRGVHLLYNRPAPLLQNTDGDALALTTDDFDLIAQRADVVERLRSIPGGEESDAHGSDAEFVITRPAKAPHRSWDNTVVGRIVVKQQRMRVETNSTRRANALRAIVETHLERMVRFRLREETNTDALMESARASASGRGSSKPDVPPPGAVAAMRAFREQHMTAWLDDSIPALDGLTPRHAATLPRMRRRLDVLLKEIEQSEARLPLDEQIDIQRLRVALGIVAEQK